MPRERVEGLRPVQRQRDDAARVARVQTTAAVSPATRSVLDAVACSLSYSIAAAGLARSRNWNFWILPVLVFGIGSKRISRGTL